MILWINEKVRCSPEPQELWQDGADEAVDEDVCPHQLAGKLEGLKACVVEQEEAWPQQQQVEQTHKPWETQQAPAQTSLWATEATADRVQTLAHIHGEHFHTKEHGNVELVLPIHSPFDHDNVDGVQHGPGQRPQRAYINISKSQRSQQRCERVADNFLLPRLPMTPFSSGLSMLEKLTRATPPMLKETKRSEQSGRSQVLLSLKIMCSFQQYQNYWD